MDFFLVSLLHFTFMQTPLFYRFLTMAPGVDHIFKEIIENASADDSKFLTVAQCNI
jgi:hypothetical protein